MVTTTLPHICFNSEVADHLRADAPFSIISAGMMRSASTLLFNTLKAILQLQTIRPLNNSNFYFRSSTPNGDKATAKYKLYKSHMRGDAPENTALRVFVTLREPSETAASLMFMETKPVGEAQLFGKVSQQIVQAQQYINYACPCCQLTYAMAKDPRATAQLIAALGLTGHVSEADVKDAVKRMTLNRTHNGPSGHKAGAAEAGTANAGRLKNSLLGPILRKHATWSSQHGLLRKRTMQK
jgi:hypothetical protein